MTPFPRLFEPFDLGPLRLKNRLVFLPHGTGMLRQGVTLPEDAAYFTARAKGGVGLVIIGGIIVHPTAVRRARKNLEAYDAEHTFEDMRAKAALLHSHDVPIIGQLFHTGREMLGEEVLEHAVAPSPLRSPRDPYPPHELDHAGIATMVRAFATTARNLARAGFDGVEIHGAHGYLVTQFLSPATNHRTDEYGGDAERRFRFLREVIEAIRAECGRPFVLGLRLTADEELGDGLDVGATTRIAEQVAALGLVDYLSVTIGVRGAYIKDITWPEAPAARAARRIRQASGLPVILGQRITMPRLAESLLVDGSADLIGMARALITDPDWPAKAAAGDSAGIRPCVGLLQDCRYHQPHLHCAVSPQTGRESEIEFMHYRPLKDARRVAVIGGGPGGMEAARVLAERGYQPVLFEAGDSLGGQFLYAAALPQRSGLTAFLDHLQHELRRLKVRVELGARISGPADLGAHCDAAILATGARAKPLPAERQDPRALSWFEVLEHGVPAPSGSGVALMVDDGTGFWFTYGVADALGVAGWQVVLVTSSASIGLHIPHESVGPLLSRLGRHPTRYRVLSTVTEFAPGTAQLVNLTSGEEETLACDLVVFQTGRAVETGPLAALQAAGIVTHPIGDCVTPRRISHTLLEAQRIARTL